MVLTFKKLLPNRRECEVQEGLMDSGFCLDVCGEYLHMLAEVYQEGIAGPASFHLYDIKWDVVQQVFQGGADVYAMAMQGGYASFVQHLS